MSSVMVTEQSRFDPCRGNNIPHPGGRQGSAWRSGYLAIMVPLDTVQGTWVRLVAALNDDLSGKLCDLEDQAKPPDP